MAKAKKEESKEVVPAQKAGALANIPTDMGAWGMDQQLTAKDITIPRILAMQGLSGFVVSGEAKFGEFRNSMTKVVMGDLKTPIDVIPFYMQKVYIVMREKEGRFKFFAEHLITPANEDHEYEIVVQVPGIGHVKERWYRTFNFYVLIPSEVAEGRALPYQLSLRSASARAGQNLITQMYTINPKAGKFPPSVVMEISGKSVSNDKGTFVVFGAIPKRDASDAEVKEAYNWAKMVKSGAVKVDQTDLETEVEGEATTVAPESNDY